MSVAIEKYKDVHCDQMITVWEQSVRATHDFLQAGDIDFYKSLVQQIDFNALDVYCCISESNDLIGFLGVAGHKLEMLFLKPEFIGKGIGKYLMDFSINELHVTEVEVNEGNTNAVNFYKRHGFNVVNRRPVDDSGKPYPILEMKL